MRSLWRLLALQWLGGKASEALAGESAVLEALPSLSGPARLPHVFDVRRIPGVSHRAMMIEAGERQWAPEVASDETPHSGLLSRDRR
jgi:hypothetical protein